MAISKSNNPWGPGSNAYDRWMKPNKWEKSDQKHRKPDKGTINNRKLGSMPLSPFFVEKYPLVTQYLRETTPSLLKNATVINNLTRLSKLPIKIIKEILSANNPKNLSKYQLDFDNSGWLDEGYPYIEPYLKSRNLKFEDLADWNPQIANVGQGLTVLPTQQGATEEWICIYITESYNQRMEKWIGESYSELSLEFAAVKFQYVRLFLHEFMHYCQNLTGFYAVKDAIPDWDNGEEFEYQTFGFTNSYSGISVSPEIKAKLGTGIMGVKDFLHGKSVLHPILEGLTWNAYNSNAIQKRIDETGQKTYNLNSDENFNMGEKAKRSRGF